MTAERESSIIFCRLFIEFCNKLEIIKKVDKHMKAKTFFKFFLTFLVLFTLIFIPIVKAVSNINIFTQSEGVESIEEEMDVLVDSSSPFFNAFKDAKRLNLLMVGVNQKMTDTIMLISWDMKNDKVDVISVPRDTYYEREGHTSAAEKKINAAYGSDGIVGTANAVSDVLYGIPINYYAVVDYDAVRAIVDGIGGVPIDVPQAMNYKDPYDTPPLVINIPAGYQTLDGDHAVQYLRYRHGYANGDIGRVEAQQKFVKAAFKQCLKHGIVDSVKLICTNVESDLTIGAASKYALSAMGLEEDSITTYTVPGEGQYIGKTSYYLQDQQATEEMLTEIYGIDSDSTTDSAVDEDD